MKRTGLQSFLLALIAGLNFCLPSIAVSADDKASSCSIYDAVYKPHPSHYPDVPVLENSKSLTFTLTAQKPLNGEKGGSHRTIFFYIDAFDLSGKKVSTLRMADTCSNGVVECAISTNEGQFQSSEKMKELEYGLGFKPIALRRDFSRMEYYGPEAPYAFILSGTLKDIYLLLNKTPLYPPTEENLVYTEIVPQFVRFYTSDKVFPDFSGHDVWVLDSCDKRITEK